jgi:predicted site-specific integrase-resolvase
MKICSLQEAAEKAGVHRITLGRWSKEHKALRPSIYVSNVWTGGHYGWTEEDIEKLVKFKRDKSDWKAA